MNSDSVSPQTRGSVVKLYCSRKIFPILPVKTTADEWVAFRRVYEVMVFEYAVAFSKASPVNIQTRVIKYDSTVYCMPEDLLMLSLEGSMEELETVYPYAEVANARRTKL